MQLQKFKIILLIGIFFSCNTALGITSTKRIKPLEDFENGLNQVQIRTVVQKNMGKIVSCYMESKLKISGKLMMSFLISPEGKVTSSSISNNTTKSKELEKCMIKVSLGWLFPKPKSNGAVIARYPFQFQLTPVSTDLNKI